MAFRAHAPAGPALPHGQVPLRRDPRPLALPGGEQLWPHEFDRELRLVRYRARAHVCNACPSKGRCTDSDHGREIVRPLDPWPHSEAGRFHRVIALVLVALGGLILLLALARHHTPAETGLLCGLLLLAALAARWLLRDLRVHPAGFPEPTASQDLRFDRREPAAPTQTSRHETASG